MENEKSTSIPNDLSFASGRRLLPVLVRESLMPRFGPYDHFSKTIRLWFDSESHTYLREFGEELVPQIGVTTALKILDKSEFLVPWAAKRVALKVIDTTPFMFAGLDQYTEPEPWDKFEERVLAAKKAPREILVDAGDVGTAAHNALEDAITYAIRNTDGVVKNLVNQPRDLRAVSCCNAALDWMSAHHVVWLSTEQKIYSRKHEFAGTMDGRCYVTSCDNPVCCPEPFERVLSVADWKSSNQLAISYLYQVSAYRAAYIEEFGDPVTDAFILRLGKEDGKFEPWHVTSADLDYDFEVFKVCLDLTRRHDTVKVRMSSEKKGRTVRKRAAKKESAVSK